MALVAFLPPNRIPIPHEPGQWIAFRKPASSKVQEARDVEAAKGRRSVKDFGGEVLKAMREDPTDDQDDSKALAKVRRVKKIQKDSLYDADNFDRATLLNGAVDGWSYVDPTTGKGVNVTPDNIDGLDEETAEWAKGVIVDLITPSKEADKSPAPGRVPAPDQPDEVAGAV